MSVEAVEESFSSNGERITTYFIWRENPRERIYSTVEKGHAEFT
jgi:hypothetical protein